MTRVPADAIATQRARWLAELSDALDEAQDLVWQMAIAEGRDFNALDLSARVEAARAEARSMRLGRMDRGSLEDDPNWSKPLPWQPLEQRA